MARMKKAFFRLMGLVLGLNVFTSCYGPAPGGWEYEDDPESEVTSDETKAAQQPMEEESAEGENAEAAGEAAPQE